jgi:hypothetical protein
LSTLADLVPLSNEAQAGQKKKGQKERTKTGFDSVASECDIFTDDEGGPWTLTVIDLMRLIGPLQSGYNGLGETSLQGLTGDNLMEVARKHATNLSKQVDSGAYLPFASALVCTKGWVNITLGGAPFSCVHALVSNVIHAADASGHGTASVLSNAPGTRCARLGSGAYLLLTTI